MSLKPIKSLYVILFFLCLLKVNGQSESVEEFGSMYTFNTKLNITDKFAFNGLIRQVRVDLFDNVKSYVVRPSLAYKLPKNFSMGMGYWFTRAHTAGVNAPVLTRNEHRIWEYLTYKIKPKNVEFENRFIFEQRYKDRIETDTGEPTIIGKSYAQRLRYRLNFNFNILKLKNEKHIQGLLSEEIRFRTKSGVSDPKFDQNNLYFYLGYKFSDVTNVLIGYGRNLVKLKTDYFLNTNILRLRLNYEITI